MKEPSNQPRTVRTEAVAPPSIRLVISSRLENVFLVGLAVNKICSHLELDEVEAGRVELCIVEAVTNSIRHSHQGLSGLDVSLEVTVLEDSIEFKILDHGAHIPPEKLRSPRLDYDPGDVNNLPEGGMGIFLMHEVMDRVTYEPGNGTNTLTLVILRTPTNRTS